MNKLIITDAMRNGIQDAEIRKMDYSEEYLAGAAEVTNQIMNDHKSYAEVLKRISDILYNSDL